MSLRRILADALDPGRIDEVRELREATRQAVERQAAVEILRLKARTEHAAALAITEAMWQSAELEARNAQADVARLLEDAARCAHEHHTN